MGKSSTVASIPQSNSSLSRSTGRRPWTADERAEQPGLAVHREGERQAAVRGLLQADAHVLLPADGRGDLLAGANLHGAQSERGAQPLVAAQQGRTNSRKTTRAEVTWPGRPNTGSGCLLSHFVPFFFYLVSF